MSVCKSVPTCPPGMTSSSWESALCHAVHWVVAGSRRCPTGDPFTRACLFPASCSLVGWFGGLVGVRMGGLSVGTWPLVLCVRVRSSCCARVHVHASVCFLVHVHAWLVAFSALSVSVFCAVHSCVILPLGKSLCASTCRNVRVASLSLSLCVCVLVCRHMLVCWPSDGCLCLIRVPCHCMYCTNIPCML